jgi:hypothetical protein
MPLTDFSGEARIEIRDGQGAVQSSFSLPVLGSILVKPNRPDGPAYRELLDDTRRERRASGWHIDVELEWEELSPAAHATLVSLIDALHARADAHEVWFTPDSGDTSMFWRVVPVIERDMIDVIYENRVRERPARLTFMAQSPVTTLPTWID